MKSAENLLNWSNSWGLSLAYSVTHSFDSAEEIVADASVALQASSSVANLSSSARAVKLARTIWDIASHRAYKLPTEDTFFKMAPLTRAICVLRTKAKFSKIQIAESLGVGVGNVSEHLDNARLNFTDGRTWIESSAQPVVNEGKTEWAPECPYWKTTAPRSEARNEISAPEIQELFASYVEGDLLPHVEATLHGHFTSCKICRLNLQAFKDRHSAWTDSVPAISMSDSYEARLLRFLKQATRFTSGKAQPTLFSGARAMVATPTFWVGLVVFASALLFFR